MNLGRRTKRSAFGFEMTPMIDVVLQLIIFFLFTSQLAQTNRSPVDLPVEQGEEQVAPPGTLVVDVMQDGRYRFEGQTRKLEDLVRVISLEQEAARVSGGEITLLIRADRSGAALHINTLANRLSSAGVRRWSLGTTVPGGGS